MTKAEVIRNEIIDAAKTISEAALSKLDYLYLGEAVITLVDDFSSTYEFLYQGETYTGISLTGEKYSVDDIVYVLFSNVNDIKKMIVSKKQRYSSMEIEDYLPLSGGTLSGALKITGTGGIQSNGGYYTGNYLFHKGYINIPQNGNLNDYTEPGWYSTGSSANTATIANRPNSVASIMEVLPNYSYGNITQRLTNYNTGEMFWRTRYNGTTWYPWARVLSTANTADFVVEQGSNYTKWNSGKLECWGEGPVRETSSTADGVWLFTESFTYPVNFVERPVVSPGNVRDNGVQWPGVREIRLNGVDIYVFAGKSTAMGRASYIAVGRWK